MRITALRMFNVKRFANRGVAIEGIGEGVNVLCKANEFGKSTSFEALHALFFQPHTSTAGDVRNLRPYSGGNPLIEADVFTGAGQYRITKQFYGGKSVQVADLPTGRLIAQADEAENFISELIQGGAGGPAGLLWVRQGVTGIEKLSRPQEESEKQVRASLLESVQGEVEAVTGGRRMADIAAKTAQALGELVTATGRPKAGERYAAASEKRDSLVLAESALEQDVMALRSALDQRAEATRRLAEMQNPEEKTARQAAIIAAQAAVDTARQLSDKLQAAEAELALAQARHETGQRADTQFREALAEVTNLEGQRQEAQRKREDAMSKRRGATASIETARVEAQTAEDEAKEARELLGRLSAAEKAREAADRLIELKQRLNAAEAARETAEQAEAELAQIQIPADAISELQDLDIAIAKIRAVRDAASPTVAISYEPGRAASVTLDGVPLTDGQERGYEGYAQLVAPGIGTITLRSHGAAPGSDQLEQTEARRAALLSSMGVADLAAARERQIAAQKLAARISETRVELRSLAPDGLPALRAAIAAITPADAGELELKADPVATRQALENAEQRRQQANQTVRDTEPLRDNAEGAFVKAETELATLAAKMQQVAAVLGPAEQREDSATGLRDRLAQLEVVLAATNQLATKLRAETPDLESLQASLKRQLSADQAAETNIGQLRENIAGLTAQIRTRSDEAVEEKWNETKDELSSAQARVAAFEQEVAILQRLSAALDTARSEASDLYLKPVMAELKPLLGLLFDDVSITFDDKTLLPHKITRNGLDEDVDRLSGGMREQLSVLTRLAFARLLARDGRPAPVILDDALVYSDDDRIEKMFDALHRQSSDQQIIIFSCRQRAFAQLGGNILQMTDWAPH